jgi:purine nucleosidase
MSRQIIIDTDPGIDDAIAILLALAAPELEVLGLVAVAGNLPLATTSANARRILEFAGRLAVPVFAGCPRPIGPTQITAAQVHGDGGLGDLVLPPAAAPGRPEHGVTYLIETLRGAPPGGITLCALGPLTNIAAALVMAPDIAAGVAELVIMGGGSHGNVTPAAEFNIHADPQAAEIVFASGLPITMVPLDVTEKTQSTPARIAALRRVGTRCANAVADLIAPRRGMPNAAPIKLHDPCVIAYLLEPALFRAREAHVAIETQSRLTLGMTVIDWHGRSGRPANVRVLDDIQPEGVYRLLAERLTHLP